MFKILRSSKNFFVHIRSSIKLIFLVAIITVFGIGIISIFYKPSYAVSLNDELLGYTSSKTEMQKEINKFTEPNKDSNIAYIDIKNQPKYSLCFLKRNAKTNDKEILDKITSQGKTYYEYYAIVEDEKEKYYVGKKDEAEQVIADLKKKNSNNINKIAYTQVFSEELKDFTETKNIVDKLYKKKIYRFAGGGSYTICYEKVNLGIDLSLPVKSGWTITSRFGQRWGRFHSGTDIAARIGTTIVASAAGTVSFVGGDPNVGYGYYLIVNHSNGVQTLYGHCSKICAVEGQQVTAGQKIAEVGSTGNSSGPHLHFEVRKGGQRIDPQNYVYIGIKARPD